MIRSPLSFTTSRCISLFYSVNRENVQWVAGNLPHAEHAGTPFQDITATLERLDAEKCCNPVRALCHIASASILQDAFQAPVEQKRVYNLLVLLHGRHSAAEILHGAKPQSAASVRAVNSVSPRAPLLGTLHGSRSSAIFAGSLSGVRSMLTDVSVGNALKASALVIAGMNTLGFAITALTKSHKITDLTIRKGKGPSIGLKGKSRFHKGTTAFIGSVWTTHAIHCHANGLSLLQPSKSLLLTGMVTLWGARLAGFLFNRVLQVGKDSRLDGFFPKDSGEPLLTGESRFPLKLAGFWATQGLWAWVVCLPVTVAHASLVPGSALGPVAWVGAAAWALGHGWEAVADQQKSWFKADPKNKGKFIDSGLFAYSRHPNYFGEILGWTGVWLTAGFPTLWLQYPWIAASPGFTAVLLLYVSGVAITEESQQKRYGSDPKFKAYKASTNLLIPGPKRAAKE